VQCGAVRRRLVDLDPGMPPGIGQRVAFHRGRDARWRGVDAVGIFLVFVWRVAGLRGVVRLLGRNRLPRRVGLIGVLRRFRQTHRCL
jgi:hypothetical protein